LVARPDWRRTKRFDHGGEIGTASTQKGEDATNYQLRAGDRVYVMGSPWSRSTPTVSLCRPSNDLGVPACKRTSGAFRAREWHHRSRGIGQVSLSQKINWSQYEKSFLSWGDYPGFRLDRPFPKPSPQGPDQAYLNLLRPEEFSDRLLHLVRPTFALAARFNKSRPREKVAELRISGCPGRITLDASCRGFQTQRPTLVLGSQQRASVAKLTTTITQCSLARNPRR